MAQATFQPSWFTKDTACNICLLHYTVNKPAVFNSPSTLKAHLIGKPHATAVRKLLHKHHSPAKVKELALTAKPRRGAKLQLPVNNVNFWKFALHQHMQPPSTLSSTSSATSQPSAPSSTPTNAAHTNSLSHNRKRVAEHATSKSSTSSSSSDDTVMYTLLKQQRQIDRLQQTVADIDLRLKDWMDVIAKMNNFLAQQQLPLQQYSLGDASPSPDAYTPGEELVDNAVQSGDDADEHDVQILRHRSASTPTSAAADHTSHKHNIQPAASVSSKNIQARPRS
jgi:hypothetical protein